jgi:transcriptional regulator with XRE-family HTH domain
MDQPQSGVAVTLRQARHTARLSQLALALRVGVSQRHVSFVESGRARPSRALVLAWLRELGAPLAVQNAALVQAGFAPIYSADAVNDAQLDGALAAIDHLLHAHDPMPGFALDADWSVVRANDAGRWLAQQLIPSHPAGEALNMLDAIAHPQGICTSLVNLAEIAPDVVAHLRLEATLRPTLAPRVDAAIAHITSRVGDALRREPSPAPLPPVLVSRYRVPAGDLAFFSMYTTFGAPLDITLESLRVEQLFAADQATREVLTQAVPR